MPFQKKEPRASSSWPFPSNSRKGTWDLFSITKGIAKGNEAAFNQFYQAYFDRMYRYLLIQSKGNEHAARDALQETMLRVLRYMKPFDDSGSFWNWLRSLAKSAFIDGIRARKRANNSVSLDSIDTAGSLLEDSSSEDPSQVLCDDLSACLELLDPEDRMLIEGKYIEGKSYQELAREMGLSQKAVESRLVRIRKKLRGKLLKRLSHEKRE